MPKNDDFQPTGVLVRSNAVTPIPGGREGERMAVAVVTQPLALLVELVLIERLTR